MGKQNRTENTKKIKPKKKEKRGKKDSNQVGRSQIEGWKKYTRKKRGRGRKVKMN